MVSVLNKEGGILLRGKTVEEEYTGDNDEQGQHQLTINWAEAREGIV